MTDKAKLEKLKKLADKMYYAAMYLTTDASRLHKAMDEYHQFIIHECKEEPVSEELKKEIENFLDYSNLLAPIKEVEFIACYFTNWQKEQMMANATKVTVHIDAGGYPYIPQLELYDYNKDIPLAREGDRYKVILIKED